MNRIIKFRAWNGEDGGFDYFDLDDAVLPNGREINQFCGLKDENGKEIYEGDIVKTSHKLLKEYKWEVVFHKGAFVLTDRIGFRNFYSTKFTQKYEIIGNIYQTPELIKK